MLDQKNIPVNRPLRWTAAILMIHGNLLKDTATPSISVMTIPVVLMTRPTALMSMHDILESAKPAAAPNPQEPQLRIRFLVISLGTARLMFSLLNAQTPPQLVLMGTRSGSRDTRQAILFDVAWALKILTISFGSQRQRIQRELEAPKLSNGARNPEARCMSKRLTILCNPHDPSVLLRPIRPIPSSSS
jgi:hypothetical protein